MRSVCFLLFIILISEYLSPKVACIHSDDDKVIVDSHKYLL